MKVIPFGKITDIITGETKIQNGFKTWFDLKEYLMMEYPGIQEEIFMVAVNTTIYQADQNFELSESDEISLLPPFSGG
jgi:molybdopterin converting factor small subunit